MRDQETLKGDERTRLLNALYAQYAEKPTLRRKFIYWRKKYFWLMVVSGAKFIKRFLDILISLSAIILLSPLMLLIAIAIKLYDGGPVFYTATRVGKWGCEFPFTKFRSMKVGADKQKASLQKEIETKELQRFKMIKDPRITPIGKFLRRTSMDELPQLWSILIGNMSLVGPRAPLPEEVANYTIEQRKRLDVTPGLTGIWQVSGRSDIPFQKQVTLDLEYIESQSLWLDLKLLLKTIPAVFFGKGAY